LIRAILRLLFSGQRIRSSKAPFTFAFTTSKLHWPIILYAAPDNNIFFTKLFINFISYIDEVSTLKFQELRFYLFLGKRRLQIKNDGIAITRYSRIISYVCVTIVVTDDA
jgi:hypothetical protein